MGIPKRKNKHEGERDHWGKQCECSLICFLISVSALYVSLPKFPDICHTPGWSFVSLATDVGHTTGKWYSGSVVNAVLTSVWSFEK